MSDFIQVITNFLESTAQFDIFQYFIISVALFGVVALVRKMIYSL